MRRAPKSALALFFQFGFEREQFGEGRIWIGLAFAFASFGRCDRARAAIPTIVVAASRSIGARLAAARSKAGLLATCIRARTSICAIARCDRSPSFRPRLTRLRGVGVLAVPGLSRAGLMLTGARMSMTLWRPDLDFNRRFGLRFGGRRRFRGRLFDR